jgi:hypothetical protein
MSVTRPRGPLPARVYWVRRLLVLGVAFALVFGIGRLLGGGSNDSSPAAQPASVNTPVGSGTAAATTGPSDGPTTPAAGTAGGAAGTDGPNGQVGEQQTKKKEKVRTPLAMPTGPCPDSDVRVAPAMAEGAYAGGDVALTLEITTWDSPACTWEVSSDTIAVKLTSGSDRVWTSQECPRAVPTEQVVLRNSQPVLVDVTWSGRRSDPDCSRTTLWAEPGYYHVAAAAFGSEPVDEQFRLLPPAPVTITPTPTPTSTPSNDEAGQGRGEGGQG